MAIRTEIIVALIGVSGVISAALIANADKLFGERQAAGLAEAGEQSPRSGLVPPALSGNPPATIPDVNGAWFDSDGSRFDFSQSGASYDYVQSSAGRQVGSGNGVLTGYRFTHRFVAEGAGRGSCSGAVAPDARTSSGHCQSDDGGEGWDFTVSR